MSKISVQDCVEQFKEANDSFFDISKITRDCCLKGKNLLYSKSIICKDDFDLNNPNARMSRSNEIKWKLFLELHKCEPVPIVDMSL